MTTIPLHIEQDTPLNLWDLIKETAVLLWKDWPREMEVSRYSLSENPKFTLRGVCPHCSRDAVFMQTTSVHEEEADRAYHKLWIAGMQCQGCNKHILGIAYFDQMGLRYEDHYPLGKPNDKMSTDIPKAIGADFSEALRCRWVDAYNATVEMCRRAIESSCIDKLGAEANKYTDIKQMIDALADKGIITATLKDVAHKIRLGGNRGAHSPKDPAESPIDPDAADAVVEFCRHYFDHVYVVPAKLAKFDFSKGKNANAPPIPGKKATS
jgi:hypothetical protein